MKKLIIAALAMSMMLLMACGGDSDAPNVTIVSPADGATFMTTDTIDVSFTVTDDVDITSILLNAPALGTGTVPASDLSGDADTEYSGRFIVPANVTADTYTITLTATDNDENSSSAEVEVTIN